MAATKSLWCKRLLEYFCLVQVLGMTCFGLWSEKVSLQRGPEEVNQWKVELPIRREKKGFYFWVLLAVGRNRLCMGCSGRCKKALVKKAAGIFLSGASAWDDVFWVLKWVSFAAERPKRGKPVKSRVANFSRKEGALLFGFSGCGKKQVM